MEDVRNYRIEEEEEKKRRDEERAEWNAAPPRERDDEVPFHIPRD
jgi:hypothetical protein